MYFYSFAIISSWRRCSISFLHIWISFPQGSFVPKLAQWVCWRRSRKCKVYRWTMENRWSEKFTWALSSGVKNIKPMELGSCHKEFSREMSKLFKYKPLKVITLPSLFLCHQVLKTAMPFLSLFSISCCCLCHALACLSVCFSLFLYIVLLKVVFGLLLSRFPSGCWVGTR
jgi:hypothetical protein